MLPKLTLYLELDNPLNDKTKGIYPVDAEVVQLNLNAKSMRLRYDWWSWVDQKIVTTCIDMPIGKFFVKYNIMERPVPAKTHGRRGCAGKKGLVAGL